MTALFLLLIQMSVTGVSATGLPSVTVNIPVEHIITGDDYTGEEAFSFILEAEDSLYPMPEGSYDGIKKVTASGQGSIDFGDIVYNYPDAYYYKLYRVSEDNSELERDDSSYRIMVAAYSDGSSGITAWKDGEDGKTDSIVFEDKYTRPIVPDQKRKTPKTGDSSSIAIWLAAMVAASTGLILIIRKRRKGNDHIAGMRHGAAGKLPALFLALLVSFCLASSYPVLTAFASDEDMAADGESVCEILDEETDAVNMDTERNEEMEPDKEDSSEDGSNSDDQITDSDTSSDTADDTSAYGTPESDEDEEIENSIDYGDPVPQKISMRALAAASQTGKIISSYSDGKGRRFKMEGMEGIALCSWDAKTPAPDGSTGTYQEITADTTAKANVIKVMYYGIKKNAADTPLKKLRVHRVICYWLHGTASLRDEAREQLPRALNYVKQFTDKPLPPESERFQVFEWTPLGNYSDKQTIVAYRKAPLVRTPEYKATKQPDRKYIRFGSTDRIRYTIKAEEIYTDAGSGSYQIRDNMANGLLHLDPESLSITVSGGSYTVNKKDDSGLWITFVSDAANGSKPSMTVSYEATVVWDNYTGGDIQNALTDYTPEAVKVTNDIALHKEVKGNLRDTTKKFEITVDLTGLDKDQVYSVETSGGGELFRAATGTLTGAGFKPDRSGNASVVFKLKGEQGAVIKDLPIGSTYIVTETENDHRASYDISADGNDPEIVKTHDSNDTDQKLLSTERETIDPGDGIATVVFTNRREMAPTSGVAGYIDWKLPGSVAGITLLTVACWMVRKRSRCRDGY